MPQSFEEWVRELASAAGISEEQLLKAAGAIFLLRLFPIEGVRPHAKSLVWRLLRAKRVASQRELQGELLIGDAEIESALRELEAEGRACIVDTYAYGPLVAVADDGTLNITQLNEKDRAAVVSTAYANRSLNPTYKTVLELCKPASPASVEERILKLLESGPKRYTDLILAGVPKARVYPALKALAEQGKVKRPKRGVYILA